MHRLTVILLLLPLLLSAETYLYCQLKYGELPYLHESLRYEKGDETLSFSRVAGFLSDFSFEDTEGQIYPIPDDVLYLESEQRLQSVTLATPDRFPREIVALHFSVGLPKELNLANPNRYRAEHSLNPLVNNLHWSQESGYIFMALEGLTRLPGQKPLRGYSLHYANQHNYLPIRLPLPEPALTLNYIGLELDLAQVLRDISFSEQGFTTHSKPQDPIAQQLRQNLTTAFSIQKLQGVLPRAQQKSAQRPLYLPSAPENLQGYAMKVGRNLPIPALPRDNPLLQTRVELGRQLFHETSLSRDQTLSCASCHERSAAFAQNSPFSTGISDQLGTRNSMPLFNLAWKKEFFWDGRAPSLRAQVLDPITDPHELGSSLPQVIETLSSTDDYPTLFARAFDNDEITAEKISLALEAFLMTLVSYNSKYDRAMMGLTTLTPQENHGLQLFMTEYEPRLGAFGADCFHCHGGALFTDNRYHNNGLGDLEDLGRFDVTQNPRDKGKFLTPSLRNIALTAPYMHDGRYETLEEVITHYSKGLRRTPELSPLDPNLAKHGNRGILLTDEEQQALIAFLHTLTDSQYLAD